MKRLLLSTVVYMLICSRFIYAQEVPPPPPPPPPGITTPDTMPKIDDTSLRYKFKTSAVLTYRISGLITIKTSEKNNVPIRQHYNAVVRQTVSSVDSNGKTAKIKMETASFRYIEEPVDTKLGNLIEKMVNPIILKQDTCGNIEKIEIKDSKKQPNIIDLSQFAILRCLSVLPSDNKKPGDTWNQNAVIKQIGAGAIVKTYLESMRFSNGSTLGTVKQNFKVVLSQKGSDSKSKRKTLSTSAGTGTYTINNDLGAITNQAINSHTILFNYVNQPSTIDPNKMKKVLVKTTVDSVYRIELVDSASVKE